MEDDSFKVKFEPPPHFALRCGLSGDASFNAKTRRRLCCPRAPSPPASGNGALIFYASAKLTAFLVPHVRFASYRQRSWY